MLSRAPASGLLPGTLGLAGEAAASGGGSDWPRLARLAAQPEHGRTARLQCQCVRDDRNTRARAAVCFRGRCMRKPAQLQGAASSARGATPGPVRSGCTQLRVAAVAALLSGLATVGARVPNGKSCGCPSWCICNTVLSTNGAANGARSAERKSTDPSASRATAIRTRYAQRTLR